MSGTSHQQPVSGCLPSLTRHPLSPNQHESADKQFILFQRVLGPALAGGISSAWGNKEKPSHWMFQREHLKDPQRHFQGLKRALLAISLPTSPTLHISRATTKIPSSTIITPNPYSTGLCQRMHCRYASQGRKSRNRAHLLGKGVPCVHNTRVETFSIAIAVFVIKTIAAWQWAGISFFFYKEPCWPRKREDGHTKVKSNLIEFGLFVLWVKHIYTHSKWVNSADFKLRTKMKF